MPRETLTRDQIVRAAVELLDAEGIDGLSMRHLGARLGAAATAVYWHVKSKDDLVVLAGDAVWSEVDLPDLDAVEWRTAATAMAHDLFAMITRHPWLVSAMSTQLMHGPGKARHDDHLLGVYETAGFSSQDAAQAATVAVTFVLGTALGVTAEIAWRTRLTRAGKADRVEELVAQAVETAQQFPRLRVHAEGWDGGEAGAGSGESGRELDYGLAAILDGLQARLSARP